MGDAPRDVLPGGVALGGDQAGDVVEGQHQPLGAVAGAHAQAERLAAPHHVHVLLHLAVEVGGGGGDVFQFRRDLFQPATEGLGGGDVQQFGGLAIDGRDLALRVQADNPGADAQQDGLHEVALGLGVGVRGAQGLLLGLQVAGHAVEGARQHRDLLGIAAGVHPGRQVAAGHPPGRLHQARHRPGDAPRRQHAQPHRPHQHQQRGLGVAQGEGGLNPGAVGLGLAVGGQGGLGFPQVVEDPPVYRPHDIEVGVRIGAQPIERPEQVAVLERAHRDVALVGGLERGLRRGHQRRRARRFRPGQDPAFMIDQVGGGKAVIGRLVAQEVAVGDR